MPVDLPLPEPFFGRFVSSPVTLHTMWTKRVRYLFRVLLLGMLVTASSYTLNHWITPWVGRRVMEVADDCIVGALSALLLWHEYQRRFMKLVTIAEVNHHVRNSLCAILMTAHTKDEQLRLERIRGEVDHIEFVIGTLVPTAHLAHDGPRYFARAESNCSSGKEEAVTAPGASQCADMAGESVQRIS